MTEELQKTLSKIAKEFGDGIVATLDKEPTPVPMVSTGVRALDLIIGRGTVSGVGGFPRSRITTLYGPESGGKSTLCLWSVGRLIANGGTAVYIDVEQGGSEEYVFSCLSGAGAPVEQAIEENRLVILRPETAEATMKAAKALAKHADLMVIDSISMMMSSAELDADEGKQMIGMKARFQTTEFNKLNPILGTTGCALVVVSHIRVAITTWGSHETTTEPNALRHMASLRIRVAKDKTVIKRDGKPFAQTAKAEIKKNKVGSPGGEIGFDIVYGVGIDATRDVFEAAVETGLIERAGSVYRFPSGSEKSDALMSVGGERNAIEFLQEHPEIAKQIESEL